MRIVSLFAMTLAGFAQLSGPALAQSSDNQAATDANTQAAAVDITSWDNAPLYQGWSANELIDEEAYGPNGEQVGEVEDFLIDANGKIVAVVIEGGGFLDIGDSHIAVPWQDVTRVGVASVSVPVTEDNLSGYGLFGGVDDVRRPGGNWRLRNLTGDYVTLESGAGYGYVRDVIFDNDGNIQAVLAEPAYGYGYGVGTRAFPYNPAYDPYRPDFPVPYTKAEIESLEPFNYGRMNEQNTGGSQSQSAQEDANKS